MSEPSLEALRAEGAQEHDPIRFHYLEVLAARLPSQPQVVQKILARRLAAGVKDYAQRAYAAACPAPAAPGLRAPTGLLPSPVNSRSPLLLASLSDARPVSPLAGLNRDLSARAGSSGATAGVGATTAPSPSAPPGELNSVRRFGEVWARISAERQVVQAFTRGPENAGPLNAHRLMLRSLALMRTLSPDYLQHFVLHVDSLLWLEQAAVRPHAKPAAKAAAKSATKSAARPGRAPAKATRAGRAAKP